MSDSTSHEVHVHRDGKRWAIEIPGVGNAVATCVPDVEDIARDLIAQETAVSRDSFDLEINLT